MARFDLSRALVALASVFVALSSGAEVLVAESLETVGVVSGNAQFVATDISPSTLVIADADDRVTVPHSGTISAVAGDYAMSFWFRPTQGANGLWRSIVFKGDAANDRNFALYLRPDSMRVHYRLSTADQWNDGGDSVQSLLLNHWNHIAYVRRGNRLSLFINGRLDSADTLSGEPQINAGQLFIGDTPYNTPALGELAEVNIYRRTLSPLEIRSLYEAKRPSRNLEERGVASGSPAMLSEAGRVGQVLRVDSDDDTMTLPNSVVLTPGTSNFSVAFWLKLENGPTGRWDALMHKGNSDAERTFALWRRPDSNRIGFRISTSTSTNQGTDSASALTVGQWTHVAYVKRGGQLELFINGVRDAQATLSGNVVYNDGPLRIGRTLDYLPARASYDDLSVFNYELRADDIQRLMAEGPVNPSQTGRWGPIIPWPVVPVSMANLPDGRVLGFSGSERTTWPSTEQTYSAIWDPETGTFEDLFQQGHNMFCAHLAMTDQGEVFVNGGRNQTNSPWTTLFDYRNNRWQPIENMATGGRWYPVTNALPTGEIITSLGTASNLRNPEKWSRSSSWSVLNNVDYVDMRQTFDGTSGARRWWAILSVAPTGELFHYWNAQENHFIDTSGTGSVRPGNAIVDVDQPTGVAIQYDAGRMIMTGGNQGSRVGHGNNERAYTIDLNGPAPVVQQTQAMRAGRTYHNLVPLPDGSVIALGGSRYSGAFNNLGAVYPAEIWDAQSGEWALTAPGAVPRNYHSTALLLTDGRVLSAGGGYGAGNEFLNGSSHQNGQVFTPPYLYNADGTLAARPAITDAPGVIRAGQSFNVTASADTRRFSMVRMGATTHAVNTDSRFLWLNTVDNGNGSYTLTPNANPNVVIPGYWMMFGLDANDVPSEAHVVRVERATNVSTPGDVRYVKLVALSEVNGNPWTTVAELNLLDGNGAVVDRTGWQVSADSEDTVSGRVGRAIDGDPATIWHTDWRTFPGTVDDPSHPHEIVVDLGAGYALTGLDYLPRQDMPNGRIVDYRVEVSQDGLDWSTVASGAFPAGIAEQRVLFGADLDNVSLVKADPSSAGTQATFSASGAGNVQYTWAWGDGTSSQSTGDGSVAHQYDAPGRYTVVVTALDVLTGREETFEFIHVVYNSGIDVANPDRWRSTTSLAYHPTRAQVWNVNPDHNSVTVIDRNTRARLAEIPVGGQPAGLAFDASGDVWVTNKDSGTLSVISAATLTGLREVELPNVNARPHGILAVGAGMIVTLEGSGELAQVNTSTNAVQSLSATIRHPRHMAIDPTRGELYVTSFITPPVPGESTSAPDPSQGVSAVEVRSASTLGVLVTRSLPYSDVERTENTGPGIPNYLGSMAVHPAGGLAYLPSKQDNVLGGANRVGGALTFDQAVRAVSLRLDLSGAATSEVLASRLQHDNASIAGAAVFGPWGVHMFTTLEGNRQIAMSLPDNDAELVRFNVGRAPQGIALSPDGTELAVHNFMDRTVQFIDIRDAVSGASLEVTDLATVATVASEALAPDVLVGKQLFYDARDDRLAALDYMSCASCHEDGGHDGRVWDFTQ
ncbi:MAG: LamG-like jellyroll fold domain-containing protein, partial [Pseudomonadota bacterium]